MNTIIRSAITAVVLVAGYSAGQAQAHTVWRYPYKGAPYAVPHTHPGGEYKVRTASECPRTVIRRSFRGKVSLWCPVR